MSKRKISALLLVLALMLSMLSGCAMYRADINVLDATGKANVLIDTLISGNYIKNAEKKTPEEFLEVKTDELRIESWNGVNYYSKQGNAKSETVNNPTEITKAGIPGLSSCAVSDNADGAREMVLRFDISSLADSAKENGADADNPYAKELVYQYKVHFPEGFASLKDDLSKASWDAKTETLTIVPGDENNTVYLKGYLSAPKKTVAAKKIIVDLSEVPAPGKALGSLFLNDVTVVDTDGNYIPMEDLNCQLWWDEFNDPDHDYTKDGDLGPAADTIVVETGKLYVANIFVGGTDNLKLDMSGGLTIDINGETDDLTCKRMEKGVLLRTPFRVANVVSKIQVELGAMHDNVRVGDIRPEVTYIVDGKAEAMSMSTGQKYDIGMFWNVIVKDGKGNQLASGDYLKSGETYKFECQLGSVSQYYYAIDTVTVNGILASFTPFSDTHPLYVYANLTAGKSPATMEIPFTDVPADAYYAKAVAWAYNHQPQITDGTSATTFGPDKNCTRGQVVTFLWRSAGCPEPKSSNNPFNDVKATDYFYKPVLWAVENGITDGTGPTTFSPAKECTNAHILTFIYRANGSKPYPAGSYIGPYTGMGLYSYAHSAAVPEWAAEGFYQAGVGRLLIETDGIYPDSSESSIKYNIMAPCPRKNVVQFLFALDQLKKN